MGSALSLERGKGGFGNPEPGFGSGNPESDAERTFNESFVQEDVSLPVVQPLCPPSPFAPDLATRETFGTVTFDFRKKKREAARIARLPVQDATVEVFPTPSIETSPSPEPVEATVSVTPEATHVVVADAASGGALETIMMHEDPAVTADDSVPPKDGELDVIKPRDDPPTTVSAMHAFQSPPACPQPSDSVAEGSLEIAATVLAPPPPIDDMDRLDLLFQKAISGEPYIFPSPAPQEDLSVVCNRLLKLLSRPLVELTERILKPYQSDCLRLASNPGLDRIIQGKIRYLLPYLAKLNRQILMIQEAKDTAQADLDRGKAVKEEVSALCSGLALRTRISEGDARIARLTAEIEERRIELETLKPHVDALRKEYTEASQNAKTRLPELLSFNAVEQGLESFVEDSQRDISGYQRGWDEYAASIREAISHL